MNMNWWKIKRPIEILLIEDNPGDVRLTQEVLKDAKVSNNLSVVQDGVEALAFLHREGRYEDAPRPDIILLDLNLPRMDGRELLAEIKADQTLMHIPVLVLTTSEADADVLKAYNLHANCYIVKPLELDRFIEIMEAIEHFWLNIAELPVAEAYFDGNSSPVQAQ
jgi:CheY-like chemotaxis protein